MKLTYDLASVEYKWSCFSVEISVRGGCDRLLRCIKLKSMKTILSLEIHCEIVLLLNLTSINVCKRYFANQ